MKRASVVLSAGYASGLSSLALVLGAAAQTTAQEPPVSAALGLGTAKIDYIKAIPLELPIAAKFTDVEAYRAMSNAVGPASDPISGLKPGLSKGSQGSGLKTTASLGSPDLQPGGTGTIVNLDFGSSGLPFSTARADLDPMQTNDQYPYRAAGKLFFEIEGKSYICSASLIKRGVVVTAAHCVAEFGKKKYYSGWQFVPGYRDGVAPYGSWSVAHALVLTSYTDGSDSCQQPGVICRSDLAVLVLNSQKDSSGTSYYAGANTGWFSYGWDRAGFASQKITHITQLGYPGCLDNAGLMQRNDAQGAIDPTHSDNAVIGSLMCGGSSGGPWLVNFGVQPKLTGTDFGISPAPNQIVGVTSWGSTNNAVKWMGASPFLSSNIVGLVSAACKEQPEACKD